MRTTHPPGHIGLMNEEIGHITVQDAGAAGLHTATVPAGHARRNC
ncbi:MAG TPA: hypothetical protein VGE23_00550 [Candidatus Paceibacterota bacterium]